MFSANCPKCSTTFDPATNRSSDGKQMRCPHCAFEFHARSNWFSAAPDAPVKKRLAAGVVAGVGAVIVAALIYALRH